MLFFSLVIKTVCVSVKKSDSVRSVKAILNEKEGISESVQSLFLSGECLRDNRKLVDCGIRKNSMVPVFVQDSTPLRLFVKPQSHHKITVIKARPCDTIESVKSSIMAEEGIRICSFNLIYGGEQLAGDRMIGPWYLSVLEGTQTLHMVTTPKLAFTLSVKMPRGRILKVEVKLWYTVRDVKTVVESTVGSPVDHLRVLYNGVRLHDLKNLSLYDVSEESVLEMVPKSIQTFVESQFGKTRTYDVYPEDLVMKLKKKIIDEKVYHADGFRLAFEGCLLLDDQTLASYNIENESSLDS